ncbi:MAG: sigma-70 family RNA polymerase sigma factor [Nevskia sp.]|nr:sigma-70 family RNA polymerase sigma factor [Nevskia sp.]
MSQSPPPAADALERALLRRVAAGDRRAFESLYAAYFTRLARFLRRLTPREELNEEAINDTFWVVWSKGGEFRGDSTVSTWIMGIAYRCALKALRRCGAAGEELSADWPDPAPQPQQAQELSDWIGAGLRHLPADQRITIELAYFMGHSCEEIARIMECPVGTVKARMFHARVKLRNLLPDLGGSNQWGGHESVG